MRQYYYIPGINGKFRFLKSAKDYVYSGAHEGRIRFLKNLCIIKVVKGIEVLKTPIRIDINGDYSFGKAVSV